MDTWEDTPYRRCFVASSSFRAPGFIRTGNRHGHNLSLRHIYVISRHHLLCYRRGLRLLLTDVPNGTRHSTYSHFHKADFDSLSTSDGLVLLDSRRIVLPLSAVKPILNLLHASHSGVNKTLALARGLYYWPGMVNDVKQLVYNCSLCSRILPSQPFTLMVTPPPSTHLGYPMQHVGLDLFSFGNRQYLICVDHWSGYPFYSPLHSLLSEAITSTLSTWFNILGWP